MCFFKRNKLYRRRMQSVRKYLNKGLILKESSKGFIGKFP